MLTLTDVQVQASPSSFKRTDAGYDLVIGAATWDDRCRALMNFGWSANTTVLIRYADRGATGREATNHRDLSTALRLRSNRLEFVDVNSFDTVASWGMVRKLLIETYERASRPIKILIDLSVIPRYLSLGVLGFGFKAGVVSSIHYLYGKASDYRYLDSAWEANDHYGFSAGSWRPLPVIGLSAGGTGGPPSHLVASVGYDGSKTRKLVDVLEPTVVSVLIAGSPGDHLFQRAVTENQKLFARHGVNGPLLIAAPIEEVAATAIKAEEVFRSARRSGYEPSALIAGPKLHSLALAIAAVRSPIANFYYVLPDRHRELQAVGVDSWCLASVVSDWVGGGDD